MLTLHLPTPPEHIEEVLHQYTNTLCTAQKNMSFVNTLLQDIAILNKQFFTIRDWLVDIKSASDITGKNRTKLAQAKSKGLIRTLISEVLTANKTWDEIKDSLCLKICNLDMHTSVSHFIEIQQNEKESLAAYIHQFKCEANRYKFDNNATMIRIFIKGLRNAHTLATRVYEKGPQSLADAIKEVEKLQAAEQLTATSLPPSSVNVMLSDDDKCFQCQESGHMACHCPHIKCFDCDKYGHVMADCPDKIPPSGTPARHRNIHSTTRHHDRSTSHHNHRDRHRSNRSRSQSHSHRYRSHSWSNTQRSCSRSYHRCPHRSTLHHRYSNTYCHQWDMPHRRSSSHRSFSSHSQDLGRSRQGTSHRNTHLTSSKPSHSSNRTAWKIKDKKHKQVMCQISHSVIESILKVLSETELKFCSTVDKLLQPNMAASSGLSGKMFCLKISKEMLFFIILAISIMMILNCSKVL